MVVIEKSEIRINLIDEVADEVNDKADKKTREEQYIWSPLLLLFS